MTAELSLFYVMALRFGAIHIETKWKRFHVNFCKFVLGVSKTASNSTLLGEWGRLPLSIHYQVLAKVIESNEGSSLRASYQMQAGFIRVLEILKTWNFVWSQRKSWNFSKIKICPGKVLKK